MTDLAQRKTSGTGPAARLRSLNQRRPDVDRVFLAGLVLVAAATAFRTWTTTRTWFYLDDFPIMGQSSAGGFDVNSLLTPYIGHLMPAGRIAAWVATRGAPYDYSLVIVELGVLSALASTGVLVLLRTLFGSRPSILLLLTSYLLSPWLITSSAWWAAGINHLPALAATAWSLNAMVHYLRRPRRRNLVSSLLWVFFGLAFAELTLLAYIPAAVISVGYFAQGSLLDRVREVWRRAAPMLVAHSVLVATYLALYLRQTGIAGQDQDVPWRGYLVNMFTVVVPSGFVGGPLRWHQVWGAQFEASPTISIQLLGLAAITGFFALGAATRHRSLRAWWIPLLQVIAVVLLIGQNRAVFGAAFILDMRFSTPLALGFALSVGLAFLPVVDAIESAELHRAHSLLDRRVPVTLIAAAFAVLALWSTQTFPLLDIDKTSPQKSPQRYFAGLEAALAEHETPVDLVDTGTPDYVFSFASLSASPLILSPYRDRVRFPSVVQDEYYAVNQDGDLVRPGLDVVRRAADQPDRDRSCRGYTADPPGTVTIPLDGPVLGHIWRLRMGYTTHGDVSGRISFGGTEVTTTFTDGKHVLETSASAPEMWDSVRIDGLDPATDLCITRLEIGTTTVPGDPDPQPGVGDPGNAGAAATAR